MGHTYNRHWTLSEMDDSYFVELESWLEDDGTWNLASNLPIAAVTKPATCRGKA